MKTALITFHAAYNYGSCLQAYALQHVIISMGFDNEIINYRFPEQKKAYRLIRNNGNTADLIKDVLQFPVFREKKKRAEKFEDFINNKLLISKEVSDPDGLADYANKYDVYISGSDQIWNKHSNELNNVDWKYLYPYLLTFTDKKKISYASSIGNTEDSEIVEYMLEYMKKFSAISAREHSVALRLTNLLGETVTDVLDPTLLLTQKDYDSLFSLNDSRQADKNYILYYSLSGINTVRKHLNWIKEISNGKKIIVNTPYAYIPNSKSTKNIVAIGPIEFLQYIKNADTVITDSYHGTLFSINFEKNFYSLCKGLKGSEYRKAEVLQKLGLNQHLVEHTEDIGDLSRSENNGSYMDKLNSLRDQSKAFLRENLKHD